MMVIKFPSLTGLIFFLIASTLLGQSAENTPASRLDTMIVSAKPGPSENAPRAYGQPEWAARSRFSPTTNAYVLSPFDIYAGFIYEGIAPKHGQGEGHLTPELEIGLPHRFQIAFEDDISQNGSRFQNDTFSAELRYALADWGKIPLNPTLFAEWKFGTGNEIDSGGEADREEESAGQGEAEQEKNDEEAPPKSAETGSISHHIPDSYELRLLLSQNLTKNTEWALNLFFESEVGLDREHEAGFSQSVVYSFVEYHCKAGMEMQFIRSTAKDTRSEPQFKFVVGPTFGFQLTRHSRLDVAPLFGVTHDSPSMDAFAVFSYSFGGESEDDSPVPVSTRNR